MKGKMSKIELKPEYEQIRALLHAKAETMVEYLGYIRYNQDCSPSFAYNLMQEVGDLAVGFYGERKRYQEIIKEYEIGMLNKTADEKFRPDEPPTGGGKYRPNAPIEDDDDSDDDYPTISQEQPHLTSGNRVDRLRFE